MKQIMWRKFLLVYFFCFLIYFSGLVRCNTDEFDNFINPEDLEMFLSSPSSTISPSVNDSQEYHNFILKNLTKGMDCFGLGGITSKLSWVFNLRPSTSDELNVAFFVMNRKQRFTVQIYNDAQFGLEWTHFDPKKNSVVIVHGFLSYSNATWIQDMADAFLKREDVNVIIVDWSRGGNTWKYWRAVANTRTVGADLAKLVSKLINSTGTSLNQFHFIGHSLGAHICSYASYLLGKVRRITGLDPAQPCFQTTDMKMLLDKDDAHFVDVIHTNARNISKLGLGMQRTCGDQDFYPNGGMKQPGCYRGRKSILRKFMPITKAKIERMICNHGRAYELFTESLKPISCTFYGYKWNRCYSSINETINTVCNKTSCSEMGINAEKHPARGSFYVITTATEPYCDKNRVTFETRSFLLDDIRDYKRNDRIVQDYEESTTRKVYRGWFFNFGK